MNLRMLTIKKRLPARVILPVMVIMVSLTLFIPNTLNSKHPKDGAGSYRENIDMKNAVSDNISTDAGLCPLLYNISVCLYEVTFEVRNVTEIHDVTSVKDVDNSLRRHIGSLSLQHKTVCKWRTSASLVLNHVDEKCSLISTEMFGNHHDSEKAVNQLKSYLRAIPSRHLIIGVLYSDFDAFGQILMELGQPQNDSLVQHRNHPNRSIIALQLRKGYPGHSTSVLDPRKNGTKRLTRIFSFGHDFTVSTSDMDYTDLLERHREVEQGGCWSPGSCQTRWRIALIIPYLNRERHLRIFLNNIVRFLQMQLIAFRIFVIEQKGDALFNRAKLLNIGYKEAQKFGHFDCYVFHDVDQIPEDLANSYGCTRQPRQLVVTRSENSYRNRYLIYFGGAIILRKEHMELINGFPNRYFGWGGEDDEIRARLLNVGENIVSCPKEIARYTGLSHGTEERNPHTDRKVRRDITKFVSIFMKTDGLSTLSYATISIEDRPLFTHLLVSFPGPRTVQEMKPIFDLETPTDQ